MINYLEKVIKVLVHREQEEIPKRRCKAGDCGSEHREEVCLAKLPDAAVSSDYTWGCYKGIATLWITDNADTARSLSEKEQAVLIYLHEYNRDRDFSGFVYAVEDVESLDMDYLEKVYRRFMGVPWDILETERCLVRESVVEDVEAFYRIYEKPSMTRFMEALFEDPEEERVYIKEYIKSQYGFYGFGVWTIIEKESGEIIGRAGLSYREGYEEPELGFLIGVPWQGRGIATEVCRAIIEYGREQLEFTKIQAVVMPENKASLRVCGKLGFRRADTVKEQGKEYYRLVL